MCVPVRVWAASLLDLVKGDALQSTPGGKNCFGLRKKNP